MGSSRTEHLVLTGGLRRALGERWHLVTALTTSEQDFGRDVCVCMHVCSGRKHVLLAPIHRRQGTPEGHYRMREKPKLEQKNAKFQELFGKHWMRPKVLNNLCNEAGHIV